ncbi:MAG: ASKHA domain-containing protein [Candidatus Adiutrix sp.]|jgi:uncharacterized 2Fe-2S/4Fe-4S cluster protein (DUF4445 family)|nr:ASKHA domain-containing protein [Candidatus Adiutrix sp.]
MRVTLKQAGQADRVLPAHQGQTILSFLVNQGLYLDAPCAGRGHCGKCRVKVSGRLSPPDEKERKAIEPGGGVRLACQTRLEGDVVLEIAAEARFSSVKGLGESEPYEVDSPLKLTDFDILDRQDNTDLMTKRGLKRASPLVLNQLAILDASREAGHGLQWGDELLKVLPRGQAPAELLAAAVDIGTTGLAVAILDVKRGEVLAQATALNPQTACGGDVISRITWAAGGPDQQARLQELVLGGLAGLILETAGEARRRNIMSVLISGNTTMIYLLAGIQPRGLAQAPYRPAVIGSLDLSHLAEKMYLDPAAKVLTAPNISAYVGGDISAGMLAVGLKKIPGTVLYIDIGTNGEIVLSHQGRLAATSCAAGPALEGMNIMRGQRATPGAIDAFSLNENYSFKYSTIADAPPTGICGSGLIDLTAALVERGLINKTGRLKAPQDVPASVPWLPGLKEGRLVIDGDVFFDQKDVRQVQLAKGAIAAGMEMLLDRFKLGFNDLDEIIIAGAFGFHLKPGSLRTIGLIPKDYQGPVRFVGNAALAGAVRMALTPNAIEELNGLAAETTVLELGFEPQFQTVFLRHLGF